LAHVAVEFSIAHPELVREWHGLSNTLVLLSVPDELRLSRLHADALTARRRVVAFHEPDLAGSLTAVALEPAARRLVARLRLALPPPPSTVDVLVDVNRGGGETMTTPQLASSDLRAQLVELAAERDALRAQLEGDLPSATRWLQRKVWRQAAALDALHRRVVAQRFVLRTLDGLGRSLTAAEFATAKAGRPDEELVAQFVR
jgi:hypothetical protein